MNNPDIFRPRHASEIDRLIARHPLALVISSEGAHIEASPLPLVLQRDEQGEGVLIGHFSRHNPQLALIRRQPRALVAFSGAQGYVSTSWFRDRRYAPTWNYEAVHMQVHITLQDDADSAAAALDALIAHVEAPYPRPWHGDEMGARKAQLAQHIVAFRARVLDTQAQFKLGQGDPHDVMADTYAGLERYGQHELALAMRRRELLEASPPA